MRCSPADMTSFIKSYFEATESNTPATRRDFSGSSTSVKPKCVVAGLSMMTTTRSTGRSSRRRGRRIAAGTCRLELLEILVPQAALIDAKLVQVFPRINPAGMPVREKRLHRVVADRLHFIDRDVALAGLQRSLARTMTAHFR